MVCAPLMCLGLLCNMPSECMCDLPPQIDLPKLKAKVYSEQDVKAEDHQLIWSRLQSTAYTCIAPAKTPVEALCERAAPSCCWGRP